MSLSSKKLIKTLNINKDYYSIENQLKRLKINKNRSTYKQLSIESGYRKKIKLKKNKE